MVHTAVDLEKWTEEKKKYTPEDGRDETQVGIGDFQDCLLLGWHVVGGDTIRARASVLVHGIYSPWARVDNCNHQRKKVIFPAW
jgi:hypothetical protein